MVKTKVYVEGGGKHNKKLNRECRRAFGKFLSKAEGVAPGAVEVEACGGRGDAYNAFKRDAGKGLPALLLVDAEGPVTAPSPWEHLKWSRPSGIEDDQCHLMAQIMESWFLADADALESFYGRQDFRRQALPKNPKVEEVPKQDVLDGLSKATQHTKKGRYNKGEHSFEILEKLCPKKVRKAAPYADCFIRALSS